MQYDYPEQRAEQLTITALVIGALVAMILLMLLAPQAPSCMDTGQEYVCAEQARKERQ